MSESVDRDALWLLWEAGGSHWAETAAEERAEAERLFAELFDLAPETRGPALRRKHFRSAALVELFLEKSRAALPGDPERADALAMLGGVVLGKLKAEGDRAMAPVLLSRIAWLAGNARRLLGDEEQAESALTSSAFALPADLGSLEHAYFLRALALLRREQGRAAEAAALLCFARRVFGRRGIEAEEAATRALLGWLYTEEGNFKDGLRELSEAPVETMGGPLTWLAARAELAYALCLVAREEPVEGWEEARDGARLGLLEGTRWIVLLADPHETARAHWLEGRVWLLLGDAAAAVNLLWAAHQWLLHENNLPAAALSLLDLADALAAAGRSDEIAPQIETLEQRFKEHKAAAAALAALRRCTAAEREAMSDPRRAFADAVFLRRTLQMRGYRVEPLPFV